MVYKKFETTGKVDILDKKKTLFSSAANVASAVFKPVVILSMVVWVCQIFPEFGFDILYSTSQKALRNVSYFYS